MDNRQSFHFLFKREIQKAVAAMGNWVIENQVLKSKQIKISSTHHTYI